MYIERNNFKTFEKLEDLGKEWETELLKPKIRGQVLQITEPRIKNKTIRSIILGTITKWKTSICRVSQKSRDNWIFPQVKYFSKK